MRAPTVEPKSAPPERLGEVPRRAVRGNPGIARRLPVAGRIGFGTDARVESHRRVGRAEHDGREHRTLHRTAAAAAEAFLMMDKKKLVDIKAKLAALLERLPGPSPHEWLVQEIQSAERDRNRDVP